MKKKVTDFFRTKFDAATRAFVKSMARSAADDIQVSIDAQDKHTEARVVKPDLRVRLTSGHEVYQYNVPQSHIPSLVKNLRSISYNENYDIAVKDVSYIVRTDHFWLTVDQTNKHYYISPAMLPVLFTCPALPDFDVPKG